MPSPEQFLRGFNLYSGLKFKNWILKKINISEKNIVKWNVYQFPIELIFECTSLKCINSSELEHELYSLIDFKKIIRSDSNRPYLSEIKFKNIYNNDNFVILKLTGYSKRVSEKVALELNR